VQPTTRPPGRSAVGALTCDQHIRNSSYDEGLARTDVISRERLTVPRTARPNLDGLIDEILSRCR
jgi:hypothetical protein